MMNAGDIFILVLIAAGMAGLAGYTVYEIMEKRDDRANEQRNGTTDYWEVAPTPDAGTPDSQTPRRSKSRWFPKRHNIKG